MKEAIHDLIVKAVRSRKFQAWLGSVLLSGATAVVGEISWNVAIMAITTTTATYLGAQGYADRSQ